MVLVVRPEPGLGETLEALRVQGRRGVGAPMQRVTPTALRLREGEAAGLRAVLLTSGQAVPAVAALRSRLTGCVVLAVGDVTARRAREAGLPAAESAAGDAGALRRLAGSRLRPEDGALLLACGAGQGVVLARSLRADGFRVLRRIAYRAVPERALGAEAAAAIEGRRVGTALFFSGEAAAAFRRALPETLRHALGGIRALAISERTAVPLRGMGWRSVDVAAAPNAAAVLALLDRGR